MAGARALFAYCAERGIRAERPGKLIVATEPGELAGLDELERRGTANGVAGLRRIGPEEIREIEPHARGIAALHSPATGLVDFEAVARGLAADLAAAAATVSTGCAVTATTTGGGRIRLAHSRGDTSARAAVLCAGAWSDRLAVAAGASPDPRIVPFRGAYVRLRPERAELVRTSIYPVPDPDLPFLGMHLTRGLDGAVEAGPSALMVAARDAYSLRRVRPRDLAQTLTWPGTWRLARSHWRDRPRRAPPRGSAGARSSPSFAATCRSSAEPTSSPATPESAPRRSGRDGTLVDDFVVSRTERALHVRNAPSPAATSSLALGAPDRRHAGAGPRARLAAHGSFGGIGSTRPLLPGRPDRALVGLAQDGRGRLLPACSGTADGRARV